MPPLPTLSRPSHAGGSLVVLSAALCRLDDNAPLTAACSVAGPVSFVYVAEEEEEVTPLGEFAVDAFSEASDARSWPLGRAARAFLHRSLVELDASVIERRPEGAPDVPGVIFRRGRAKEVLPEVARALGVARVLCAVRYEPAARSRDAETHRALAAAGFDVVAFPGFLLHAPEDVRLPFPGKWVGHYGTLTPFVAACRAIGEEYRPHLAPQVLPPPHSLEQVEAARPEALGALRLDEAPMRWSDAFDSHWRGFGEAAAATALRNWTEGGAGAGFARYERDRSRADAREAVSRLSPYLRLGIISPRRVLGAIERAGGFPVSKTGYRRLFWRDLAYWQLHHWPALSQLPIRSAYLNQRWLGGDEAQELLEGWRAGCTGFPLVDAAMRELKASGYISQSVRMSAAAYLVDYCNIDWREGARHFHDYLVDGDLAINGMMWQNASKCGIDQWSFTVSPIAKASDPTGEYIRRWVPELRALPKQHTHEPWNAPADVLRRAGVVISDDGEGTYPARHPFLHDLHAARERALAAAREARATAPPREEDANGYDVIDAPRGSTTWDKKEQQRIRVYTIPPLRGKGKGTAGASSRGSTSSKAAAKAKKNSRHDGSASASSGKKTNGGGKGGGKGSRKGGGGGGKRQKMLSELWANTGASISGYEMTD